MPLLTGKALEAYTAMDEVKASNYQELKQALLEKFNVMPVTYRQQFRAPTMTAGETPTETYYCLKGAGFGLRRKPRRTLSDLWSSYCMSSLMKPGLGSRSMSQTLG